MPSQVCLLCKSTTNTFAVSEGEGSARELQCKFWKFVNSFLLHDEDEGQEEILRMRMSSEKNAQEFICESCELRVSSICESYGDLLTAQVRLSKKLGEMGKLLEGSKSVVHSPFGKPLIKSLWNEQLSEDEAACTVEQLRSWLMKKCTKCKNFRKLSLST